MTARPAFVALLLSVIAAPPLAAQAGRPFTTEDALDVRTGRIAAVTQDGRWIAATVSTRRGRSNVDHMRYGDPTYLAPSLGELVVIDATSGARRSLFEEQVQVRSPAWEREGSRLAFFKREGDGYRLLVHDAAANRTSVVTLRTEKDLSTSSPLVWAPDGRSVLVTLRPEGWAAEARRAFLDLTEGPVVVQDSRSDFLDWDRVRNLDRRRIPAVVTVADGSVRELTGETNLEAPRFTEDGTRILYTGVTPKRTSYERAEGTEYGLFSLPVAGGEPTVLLEPAERRLTAEWNEAGTAFAYVDKGDVYVRAVDTDSAINRTDRHRVPISDEDTTKISFSLELWRPDGGALLVRSQKGYHLLQAASDSLELVYAFEGEEDERPSLAVEHWTEDGRYLYLTTSARDRWERGLLRYDLGARRVEDLVKDASVYADWNVSKDGTRIAFRMSDGDRPDELYATDGTFSDVRRLTDLNPQLEEVAFGRSELVEYLDVDGEKLYGILHYPPDFEAGKKYPMVAEIYETFFDNGFNENMQLVTARGWVGFRPSVRFETGYPSEAWLKGVTTGVNELIERGLVDEKRQAVYGQSYGGYAVNLLVTQTNRFAAAANVSGKVNIISFLGDSPKITTRNYNAAEEGQDRIGATLWEQPQKYIEHSAVMFADRIETPLLLLSGEGDWNVPATNQREMYYALRRLGKEVVWVNYMKGGHGAGRASDEVDFHDHWRRMFAWFSEHFDEETPVTTAVQRATVGG